MRGDIGDLFVICMRQVTIWHSYHLLEVYCGNLVGCVSFCERFVVRGRNFDVSPNTLCCYY